jgi:hypothetical protein
MSGALFTASVFLSISADAAETVFAPLPHASFADKMHCMSTVELAISKVKRLSARQARELLAWLNARQADGISSERHSRKAGRKTTPRQSIQRLKAWQDSVRGVTGWEPPRMPDDLVNPVRVARF